nr:proton-conducting transporter membrane subunit [Ignavibacteriaceae bacterium]
FHFWLPNAMEAPTPVSAYLHSATMVKAGIYLIARMNHILGGTELWQDTILVIGTITMLIAAFLSFNQTDLKKLLAYSTLSVLGILTMLLGIGSNLAIKAFFIFLVAHSLYKGTLFLVAGNIDHETGTREISSLGGLKKYMPFTMLVAVLASLSMMGIIPLIGFISKETVYSAILELEQFGLLLLFLAFIANAFIVTVTILVGIKPFLGKLKSTPNLPHEAPLKMLIGPVLLSVLGLLMGIFPNFFIQKLLDQSTFSILTTELGIKVKAWHGFNFVLFLSFLTLLTGLFLFYFRAKVLNVLNSMKLVKFVKPSYWYQVLLDSTLTFGKYLTRLLQNGYLRYYIIFIVLTTLGLAGYSLLKLNIFELIEISGSVTIYEVIIAIIIVLATFLVITSDSRLKAIVAIGAVGFCMGIIFILYSAPDLALTTIAIETLTVILFVLILYRLPKYLKFSKVTSKTRDIIIASGVGVFMTLIVLLVSSVNMRSELKSYFADVSVPGGKGRNIVNVILVDFRAIDTLGEITVLAVAALGVYALIKLRLTDKDE